MDFERIQLLLTVFHESLDVPHTDKIRMEIMEELKSINNLPSPEPINVDASGETELNFGARRL